MDEALKKLVDEALVEFFDQINESAFRIYNQTLCPDLWDENQHLDPRVRVNLLRMAYDFYKKTEFVAPILDVWLMGSIANYNWTPESDADVHIIIDFSQLKMPPETASKVAKSAGASWNSQHNVTVKGHKVEINIQSVKAKKPYVMGIYSLVKDEWVKKPCPINPQINKPAIQEKFSQMKKYVEFALNSGNREEMKKAKDFLDDFRQYGLDHGGELSTENIVYKILRSKGMVKALKDAITATYDKEMTVQEVGAVAPTYRDDMADDDVFNDAERYFGIGHDDPDEPGFTNAKGWVWVWDGSKIIAKQGTTHGAAFSHEVSDRHFKGRFDPEKNAISVVFPEYELRKLGGARPTVDDIPQRVYQKLLSTFKTTNPRFEVFEILKEVGMKDLKQTLPRDPSMYKYADSGELRLDNLTLDNLAALRAKSARSIAYLKKKPESDPTWLTRELAEFKRISQEMKRRMGYINQPVAEGHDADYGAAEDFYRRRDEQLYDLAYLLKSSKGQGKVPWKTVPASLLKKVWLQFGKYHRINDNDLDKIADQILTNIARLQASTEMMGHTQHDVRPELADNGIEFTDEEWETWMSNYFTDKEGGWLLSDYGLDPLKNIYALIFNAKTPEEKLYAVDKALNVVHQRSDLASMFVQGGSATLTAVANQGGYNAGGEYGDVNKEFRNEGVGWGDPKMIKKDPLHIPGERWRIKWYTNRKTPKMKQEEEKFIQDLVEQLLMESPEMKTLKDNKKPLTDEERQTVMDADAVWHMGKDGGPSPAVWKSVVRGKTWYVTNTHRCYQCKPTLKGAIRAYHKVVKQSA